MAPKPFLVKITDFETSFDAFPVTTREGEVIWSDVRIDYVLPSGQTPQVMIRVPILWSPYETTDQRRAIALRCARELIDHACRASGLGSQGVATDDGTSADALESITPSALEGVAQELGLAALTTKPRPARR
jgi:hypothetical protein